MSGDRKMIDDAMTKWGVRPLPQSERDNVRTGSRPVQSTPPTKPPQGGSAVPLPKSGGSTEHK